MDQMPPSEMHYFLEQEIFTQSYFAGIVKIPTPQKSPETYKELPCLPEDEKKILELVTTLSTHGKLDLLLNYKKHLEKIGEEVGYVHPLKFLGIIFSRPENKEHMKNIREDYFKWKNFIEGLSPGMASHKRTFQKYLRDFSKHVRVSEEKLQYYIDHEDWTGFVEFLIHN